MRWVRAVPDPKPDRPHVVDQFEVLRVEGIRYGAALATLTGDVIVLEWDIVVEPDVMARFEAHVAEQPDRPAMAPYRLWASGWAIPPWSGRQGRDGDRWLQEGELWCDQPCTGFYYLPAAMLEQAKAAGLAGWDYAMTDTLLARWAISAGWSPVRVLWDCRAMHIHFDIART